ncbi:HesB family protein [Youngiibacter fragilis 232.1]|uniref:HesB family protein n=2 Tax=Youngiibacter TaxID=1408818 RepID=V7I382_9CLOT|nr:HesB family protein [Youngiibacter fragilis 232.1]
METVKTGIIEMSEEAYSEFFDLLEINEIEPKIVRIALAGYGCSGPSFGLMMDEPGASDVVQVYEDITFIVAKELYEEYDGFKVLSDDENYGGGMSLRPRNTDTASGCSTCASGCAV